MDLFDPIFMISAMTYVDIVDFLMVTFPVLPLVGFTFLNLLSSLTTKL